MRPTDSLKGAILALVRAAMPTVDYFALYRARVVSQSSDRATLELAPEDPRLPGMSKVPVKAGIPGATWTVTAGAYVLVGWEGGDPQRPHAIVWEGGASVPMLTLVATKVEIGAANVSMDPTAAVVIGRTPCQFTGAPHLASGGLSISTFVK